MYWLIIFFLRYISFSCHAIAFSHRADSFHFHYIYFIIWLFSPLIIIFIFAIFTIAFSLSLLLIRYFAFTFIAAFHFHYYAISCSFLCAEFSPFAASMIFFFRLFFAFAEGCHAILFSFFANDAIFHLRFEYWLLFIYFLSIDIFAISYFFFRFSSSFHYHIGSFLFAFASILPGFLPLSCRLFAFFAIHYWFSSRLIFRFSSSLTCENRNIHYELRLYASRALPLIFSYFFLFSSLITPLIDYFSQMPLFSLLPLISFLFSEFHFWYYAFSRQIFSFNRFIDCH